MVPIMVEKTEENICINNNIIKALKKNGEHYHM
jgi:hypothetical protein